MCWSVWMVAMFKKLEVTSNVWNIIIIIHIECFISYDDHSWESALIFVPVICDDATLECECIEYFNAGTQGINLEGWMVEGYVGGDTVDGMY